MEMKTETVKREATKTILSENEKMAADIEDVIQSWDFRRMMTLYKCAIMEVETKLNVLNAEFSLQYDRNPFESIKTRLKSPESIVAKLKLREIPVTVENMESKLYDIAGIRVICSFKEDIYRLADLLVQQDDILLFSRKDYIENPKANGYRSLHMILDIPIFLAEGKKHMKVEVQFRTIAMDFWASVDHKLKYKKQISKASQVQEKLKNCADMLSEMDNEMEGIRQNIDKN